MGLVALTGATGHVGACLLRQLLSRGESVRVLVRDESHPALAGLEIETVVGDLREPAALDAFVEGVDVLYHCAAVISIVGPMNGLVNAVNVEGARALGQAALRAGVRRMVHMSSVHAFDHEPAGEPLDETRRRVEPGRAPAYDVSKAGGEAAIRELVEQGLDAVVVHPSAVIGPFDYAPSRMGQVLLDLFHRRLPSLVEGGFDFVDVRDVCAGAIAAAERGRTNESYLLTGHYLPVKGLAMVAEAVTGVAPPRINSPMWLARVGAPFMEAWAKVTSSEPLYTSESLLALRVGQGYVRTKAERELGHRPRSTVESVKDAYAWLTANDRLRSAPEPLRPDAYGAVPVQ